jgi:nucleoid-associated protein
MDQLLFATIHFLQKDVGERNARISLRDSSLDVDKPAVVELAKQLSSLVGKNESTVYWGQFGNRKREGRFPDTVASYAEAVDEKSFMELSSVAMDELAGMAGESNFATGGYLFFAHYLVDESQFVLVAMIKERDAITLNEDFEPEVINEIDLSKLHQAARVNLNRYVQERQRATAPTPEEREKTYLCFVNRQGRDEVATYFIDALGCEKGVSSARTTSEVIKAIRSYMMRKPPLRDKAHEAKRAVIDFMNGRPDNSVVTLDQIVGVVGTVVNAEQHAEIADLKETLNGENHQVPENFAISYRALKAHAYVSAKTPSWRLTFDTAVLGTQDAEIQFDPETSSLTLTQLPEKMIEKVTAILRERRELEEE